MIAGLSYLDAALIAIVAMSGLVAMYRGFTREILSILSWVAAAGACVYFVFKYKAEAAAGHRQAVPRPAAGRPSGGRRHHLPGGADRRSPHHGAHLRHRARQPGRRHRPHPGAAVRRRARLRVGGDTLHVRRLLPVQGQRRGQLTQGCRPGELPVWVENAHSYPYQRDERQIRLRILCAHGAASLMGPASNSKVDGSPSSGTWQHWRAARGIARCELSYMHGAPQARSSWKRDGSRGRCCSSARVERPP